MNDQPSLGKVRLGKRQATIVKIGNPLEKIHIILINEDLLSYRDMNVFSKFQASIF
jgi:hypothetical protein